MRRLFDTAREGIADFVEQRDDLLMLAACAADDLPIALKLLRDVEQATETDVYFISADSFISPASFVSVAVDRFREEHRLACEGLAAEGLPVFPPLPETLSDARQPPAERLRELICFARTLVPREGGHRLVWAMFPQEIADRPAYLNLVSSFIPRAGIKPWMRGLRLIFRDEAEPQQRARQFTEAPRVRVNRVDFGPEAVAASLEEEVADEDLSVEERMQSLFTLASLDTAHNRIADALARYKVLLGHYQQSENQLMQALVMNGIGDVYQRNEDLGRAQRWYECAITPALAAQVPVVLATLAKALGDVAYKLGQYAEAEQYYDNWDKLAGHMLDAESKARALEWRGLCQEQQGAYVRATRSWEDAATLSRNTELPAFLKTNLEHLRRVYPRLRRRDKLAAVEAELKRLEREEVSA
ncbi:MAG: tetratricopeptide repeat protein [Acidobacteria bacterium]|nr:tetratricopeptide repeat protein [Acidobacteriota bacterium]